MFVAPKGKFVLRFLFLKCLFILLMYKALAIKNKISLYIKNDIKLELNFESTV